MERRPHYLTLEEKQLLRPRPDLPKFCARRHRLRTPAGMPTDALRLYWNGLCLEGHGCRRCRSEQEKAERAAKAPSPVGKGFKRTGCGVRPFA